MVAEEHQRRRGYDPLNRIKAASYLRDTLGVWGNAKGQFSESGYQYDMNGNIKNLVRNGSTGSAMDNLTYSYTGNQLQSVAEGNGGDPTKGFIDGNLSGSDYHYDANGNMDHDFNKKIGTSATDNAHIITYNHLNLPVQVIKNTNEKIIYTYDAGGRKLKQDVYNASNAITKTTDYDGAFIYQGDTLQFINHEEGRIVMKNVSAPEYQYHLKDHLGNVRVTFTTEPTVKKFTAGFETANQTTEASPFGASYPDASHINTVAINAHSGSNSLYLNGSANGGQVAMAKSLSVMPGDVVSIQAYAKYYAATGTQSNLSGFATALVNAFGMTAPIGGETGTARSALYTWGGGEAGAYGDGSNDHDDPRVFVTILMFDRNFVFQDVTFQQLTSSGVMNASYTAKQPGYAYIYVSNEEANLRDVYFDDVTITQTQSPVIQQEDFYPFGLAFNSYSRESIVSQNYLYNGKEQINDLNIDWADYGARMYMPEIGRWGVVDPLAETSRRWSVYNYAMNNPVLFIDPDGMETAVPDGGVTFQGFVEPDENGFMSGSTQAGTQSSGISVDRKRFGKNGEQLKGLKGLFKRAYEIQTTVTIRNAKILNESNGDGWRNATHQEVQEAGETMAREIMNTWNGSSEKNGRTVSTAVIFEGGIQVVDNPSQVESSDFLMRITNDNDRPGALGEAPRGGNWINVDFSHSYLGPIMSRNDDGDQGVIPLNDFYTNSRVASHEIGHSGILRNERKGSGIMSIDMGKPTFRNRWDFFRGR